jgi:hypothetical protein
VIARRLGSRAPGCQWTLQLGGGVNSVAKSACDMTQRWPAPAPRVCRCVSSATTSSGTWRSCSRRRAGPSSRDGCCDGSGGRVQAAVTPGSAASGAAVAQATVTVESAASGVAATQATVTAESTASGVATLAAVAMRLMDWLLEDLLGQAAVTAASAVNRRPAFASVCRSSGCNSF